MFFLGGFFTWWIYKGIYHKSRFHVRSIYRDNDDDDVEVVGYSGTSSTTTSAIVGVRARAFLLDSLLYIDQACCISARVASTGRNGNGIFSYFSFQFFSLSLFILLDTYTVDKDRKRMMIHRRSCGGAMDAMVPMVV